MLSDEEIKWFWGACEDVGYPFGHIGKLLLLTLQRRSEISDLRWPEIDPGQALWTIPSQRTKNATTHVVHLSAGSLRVLAAVPSPQANFVFTTIGERSVSGFARAKELLDKAMLVRRRRGLGLPESD